MEFNKKIVAIYMITSPSNKSYIGRTLDYRVRINKYKNLLCKDQTYIYNAILKYGWDNMKVTILYSNNRSKYSDRILNILEKKYIKLYNTLSPIGYNLKTGGEKEYTLSQETKNKISNSHKNKVFTRETLEKMRKAKLGKEGYKKISIIKYDLNMNKLKNYSSIREASKLNNILETSINNCLKNRSKTAGGFIWHYNSTNIKLN